MTSRSLKRAPSLWKVHFYVTFEFRGWLNSDDFFGEASNLGSGAFSRFGLDFFLEILFLSLRIFFILTSQLSFFMRSIKSLNWCEAGPYTDASAISNIVLCGSGYSRSSNSLLILPDFQVFIRAKKKWTSQRRRRDSFVTFCTPGAAINSDLVLSAKKKSNFTVNWGLLKGRPRRRWFDREIILYKPFLFFCILSCPRFDVFLCFFPWDAPPFLEREKHDS